VSVQTEPARYTLVIEWSDEDGVYIATAPELPGCRTHGATRVEALQKGEEIVAEWLDIAIERKWPIPAPRTFDGQPHVPVGYTDLVADALAPASSD
jgi:predicted RNase H-like HicB family nuclease